MARRRRRARRPGALTELPPLKIASQIAALQSVYYLVSFVLTIFTSLASGTPWSTDLMFGWTAVRGDITQGWLLGLLMVLDGGVVVGSAIVVLIGRSKLAPDFAITTQTLHLLVVYLYTSSLPRTTMWWLSAGASAAIASFLGILGSRSRELQPISFGGRSRNGNPVPVDGERGGGGTSEGGDLEAGYEMGRGRGAGRDGEGVYEMVNMERRQD